VIALLGLLIAVGALGAYRWYVVRDFRGARSEVSAEDRAHLHSDGRRAPPSLGPPST
jgi:hypothetical protein